VRGPLDARFDPAVDMSVWRSYHARIPADRLESLVLAYVARAAAERGEPNRGSWGIGFASIAEDAAPFVAKCPTERLARAVLGLAALSGIGGDTVTRLRKLKRPAVVKALAEYDRREANAHTYAEMRAAMTGYVDEVFPRGRGRRAQK
jgi:hypothetical protein